MYSPIPGHEERIPPSPELGKVHIWRPLLCHSQHVPHRPPNAIPSRVHHIRPSERRLHFSMGPNYGLEFG